MTIQLNAAAGLRNDVPVDRFDNKDLDAATNIDIDETGKVSRRLAYDRVAAGNMHSLRSFGSMALVVKDGVLSSIRPDGSGLALTPGITGRVAYSEVNGSVFWTDRTRSGVVRQGYNHNWGIKVPALPAVNVVSGELRAGTYLYTMTYVREDGVESGAPLHGSIAVDNNTGLQFVSIPVSDDPSVVVKRIYLSTVGGELPYVAATILNSETQVSVVAAPQPVLPVRTMLFGPPPAGQVLGYYNGRIYIGSGRFLWYSQPYEYELFDLAYGFLALDSDIKTIAPVATGIYVGTSTETVFLQGVDPLEFKRIQVAPYGTVLGTETYVRNDLFMKDGADGMVPVWMSRTGLCAGLSTGEHVNLTSDRYIVQEAEEGATLLKFRSGTPQLVVTTNS